MIYPFTVILKRNLPMMFKALESLGYHFIWSLDAFQRIYKNVHRIYVVINDTGVFGNAHFYGRRTRLNPGISRIFIADEMQFLKECAKLKGKLNFSYEEFSSYCKGR